MRLPGRQPQDNSRRVALHLLHRRVEPQVQAIAEPGEQGADVFPGTAGHHVPLRTIANIQQTVVFKEAQKQRQREAAHLLQRRRPDGRPHRQNIVAGEEGAEAVAGEEALQRRAWIQRLGQRQFRQAVEADDLAQQSPEGRLQQIAPLGEERGQAVAVVLQAAGRVVDRELICVFCPPIPSSLSRPIKRG